MTVARAPLIVTLAFVLAGALGGCAKKVVQAAPAPVPPLEVPVAPPRVLGPVEEPPAPPSEPEPRETPQRPARPRQTPRPVGAPPETRPDAPKPEGAPAEPPVPTASPDAAREPPVTLKTPQTANETEAERRVREVLGRASRQLARVNRAALNSDARAQFDTAQRFIAQATDALKVRNFMFAAYLAEKAETLANGLGGR